ncbi:MAG: HEPN domain-containing protein [Anaerolineae bacterium]
MRRDSLDRVQGKRFPPDDPREWLNRARSNLAQAREGAQIAGVYLEDLCFSAQQAAEKAIKAVLIQYEVEFPYVHDLAKLLGLVEQTGQEVPSEVQQAARLTRYAVVARYPGLVGDVTRDQYDEAVTIAEEVVRWAESIIGPGSESGRCRK